MSPNCKILPQICVLVNSLNCRQETFFSTVHGSPVNFGKIGGAYDPCLLQCAHQLRGNWSGRWEVMFSILRVPGSGVLSSIDLIILQKIILQTVVNLTYLEIIVSPLFGLPQKTQQTDKIFLQSLHDCKIIWPTFENSDPFSL